MYHAVIARYILGPDKTRFESVKTHSGGELFGAKVRNDTTSVENMTASMSDDCKEMKWNQ